MTSATAADPSSSFHLSTILSTYKSLDLPSLQSHLTALTTPLTHLQTSSLQSRKKLAEETRAWKKLDTDQAKIDGVKPLLKLYQAEVDELTKRAREAEGGVQRVEERLRGVEDPYAVLERLIVSVCGTDRRLYCQHRRELIADPLLATIPAHRTKPPASPTSNPSGPKPPNYAATMPPSNLN